MRRERLIGETIISFASIDLELETNLWLPLEPRNSSIVSDNLIFTMEIISMLKFL